ncbi:MAG: Fur family transcriptional regulator [Cyanobacteria bacterium P01_H01_bin.121]
MSWLSDGIFRAALNEKGWRLTAQRQKICDLLQALAPGEHYSAEQIQTILQQQGERVGVSTVYRTLHVMVDLGWLRELELAEGHKSYELRQPAEANHHHLVCLSCNQTIEFTEDLIEQLGRKQAEAAGYHVLDCQLTLYGICQNCNR